MLKSIKLKRILKETVFKPLNFINKIVPKRDDYILLYSANMEIRHNLKPLRDKLLEDGYYKKYHIVCAVENKKYYDEIQYVKYVARFGAMFVFLRAKHVFYTAGQIPVKPSKNQIVIHMNHGTSDLKACGALTNIQNGDEFFFTYMLAPSDLYVPIFAREYLCPEENIKVCGEPMTDAFYRSGPLYDLGEYSKKILWLPTFRQSEYLNYSDSREGLLPMFSQNEYDELNQELKKHGYLLIVKIHTAQDVKQLTKKEYSNIWIFTNDDFIAKGYDLYDLMPQTDALIGDYSSASLQYLLLDKPLAFVVPDIEEYKATRGFCFEKPEEYMPGPIIKEKQGLYKFFDSLEDKGDPYLSERHRVRDLIFKYQDGNNADRVLKLSGISI